MSQAAPEVGARTDKPKACNKCGGQIIFEYLKSGKWAAIELDGRFHNCKGRTEAQLLRTPAPMPSHAPPSAYPPAQPPATARKSPMAESYYSGIQEVREGDAVQANEMLKQGWLILKITERNGYSFAGPGEVPEVVATSEIVYILGRKSDASQGQA